MWQTLFCPKPPSNVTLANSVSALGAWLCALAGLYAAQHAPLVSVATLFLIGSGLDAVDGWIARRCKEVSSWGAYVDAMCDKIGEAALLIGLATRVNDPVTIRWFMVAASIGFIGSYQKALVAEKGRPIPWPEAKILGRGLRIAVLVIGLLTCGLTSQQDRGLVSVAQALALTNTFVMVWREKRIQITAFLEMCQNRTRP